MKPGDTEYLAWQRADLLRFALGARHPLGFGWLDGKGRIETARPVELWITCRMTHVACLGLLAIEAGLDQSNSGPEDQGMPSSESLRDFATHGVQSLLGPLRDKEHDGWFASVDESGPVDERKQAYGHAFVILAGSSAMAAGIEGGEQLFNKALSISTMRFLDESTGLSVDEWNRDWTALNDYRGINANMHTVEAYLAAGDVSGDGSWHTRAGRIAERVVAWAREFDWRIPEHFTVDWQPMPEHNRDKPADPFQPYGATVGHGLEWARLLLAVEASLGSEAPAGLIEGSIALYRRAREDGWAADGANGFVYTTDWSGQPVVRARMHWVVNEALNTANALHRQTADDEYAADAQRWWAYADQYLIDHQQGSWIHELDADNRQAATVWHGKPDVYHAYQAALLPQLPLTPSFAAALVQMVEY